MSTRTTGKRETLQERVVKRSDRSDAPWPHYMVDSIRAELERLAREVKKLKRFAPGPVKGCHCQICSVHSHTLGAYLNRNDVLALLKQAKRYRGRARTGCGNGYWPHGINGKEDCREYSR